MVSPVVPSCQRPTPTSSAMKRNPAVKETNIILLCFRKRSENEGELSSGFIMESYQSSSVPILTENDNNVNVPESFQGPTNTNNLKMCPKEQNCFCFGRCSEKESGVLSGIKMEEGLINKIVAEKNKRHVFCVTK